MYLSRAGRNIFRGEIVALSALSLHGILKWWHLRCGPTRYPRADMPSCRSEAAGRRGYKAESPAEPKPLKVKGQYRRNYWMVTSPSSAISSLVSPLHQLVRYWDVLMHGIVVGGRGCMAQSVLLVYPIKVTLSVYFANVSGSVPFFGKQSTPAFSG